MSVVHAAENVDDATARMNQITLDIEKAASRLRCAERTITATEDEEVDDAVCVIEEVAECLTQIRAECSSLERLFHFFLLPTINQAMQKAIAEYLATVDGDWPDYHYCVQAFLNHSVVKGLLEKDAIAKAGVAYKLLLAQDEAKRPEQAAAEAKGSDA